jgi:hypothetical protein
LCSFWNAISPFSSSIKIELLTAASSAVIRLASTTLLSASSEFPFRSVLPSSKVGSYSKNGRLMALALFRRL